MISKGSRYVDSNLLSVDDKFYWGLWSRIDELVENKNSIAYKEHRVSKSDVGCLDIIAVTYYGNERLWWFIAAFNNIIDPVKDMYVGKVLKIPNILFLQKFLTRS